MALLSARVVRDRYLRLGASASVASLLDPTPLESSLEAYLPDGSSSWAITPSLGRLLARAVVTGGRRRILEFGAGSSSIAFAGALSAVGGGALTSIEGAPEWCTEQWSRVVEVQGVDARLVPAQLRLGLTPGGLAYRFDDAATAIAERGPFDFVLVDAPQFYYGRDGGLFLAWSSLADGALIVLDDAAREGERYTIARWLRAFPGLELLAFEPEFGGRGVAVLRRARDTPPRYDWWALATSAMHALRNRRLRATLASMPDVAAWEKHPTT